MKNKVKSDIDKNTFFKWLAEERAKISSIEEIGPWFLKNQQYIMSACNSNIRGPNPEHMAFDDPFVKTDNFTKLVIDVIYIREMRTTHACPDNVEYDTPEGRKKTRKYKGWSGYLGGTLVRPEGYKYRYPYNVALNLVGLKTGSGGGGNENFGYQVSIFLDDWPGLQGVVDSIEQDLIIERLSNIC